MTKMKGTNCGSSGQTNANLRFCSLITFALYLLFGLCVAVFEIYAQGKSSFTDFLRWVASIGCVLIVMAGIGLGFHFWFNRISKRLSVTLFLLALLIACYRAPHSPLQWVVSIVLSL
jgi:hypothetical protein